MIEIETGAEDEEKAQESFSEFQGEGRREVGASSPARSCLLTQCHSPCRICQPGSDTAVITLPAVQRSATEHQRVTCLEPGWNNNCIINIGVCRYFACVN